jgi:hypothetical protein
MYMLGRIARQKSKKVVSSGQGMDCAVSRQMSASLIKLDFRPVFREAERHSRRTVEYRRPLLVLLGKVCCLLAYFTFLRVTFLERKWSADCRLYIRFWKKVNLLCLFYIKARPFRYRLRVIREDAFVKLPIIQYVNREAGDMRYSLGGIEPGKFPGS